MEKKESKFKQLDKKTKTWYIVLSIITLSLFYWYIRHKIKQAKNQQDHHLQDNIHNKKTKLNFNLNELISALGEKENIINSVATLSALKISVKDKSKVNINQLKALGAKGIIVSENKVNIVLGDQSPLINDLLLETIEG